MEINSQEEILLEDSAIYGDNDTWKIFIVDDDPSIHEITQLVLSEVDFEDKPLTFLHAYDSEEAKSFIKNNPDIAMILLDVVMECEDAGLQFVKYVRKELNNHLVRIIIRTGQPGLSPEAKVIKNYDVNDYKEKTDLTVDKLTTLTITSLRAYKELLESYRKQAEIHQFAQRQLREKDEYLKLMADALPVLISFIDSDEIIRFNNKTYELWFNRVGVNEISVKNLIGEDAYITFKSHWEKSTLGKTLNFDLQLPHYYKGERHTNVTLVPYIIDAKFKGCFSLVSDITERKQIEENLEYLAKHDVLTGVYNRIFFDSYIEKAIERSQERNKKMAVLFLDIDEFKKINDHLGHEYGDMLLLSIATRLKESLRAGDTMARFGGDEFVILLEDIDAASEVVVLVDKIMLDMSKPFLINRKEQVTTISVGVSVYPDDGTNKEMLLKNSDLAMYHSKKQGKNTYRVYSSDMSVKTGDHAQLGSDIQFSIFKQELEMFYRPVLHLPTKKITAVEATVYWHHPAKGLLAAEEFASLIEDSGNGNEITEWILQSTCKQIADFHQQGFPELKVLLNIPLPQFIDDSFLQQITLALKITGLDPHYLQLGLLENMLMSNFSNVSSNIEKLKAMDVDVFLTKFGAGFSNLNYLSQLKIAGIKIDESFSRLATTDLRKAAIVSTIGQLMRKLNIQTAVGDVETKEQVEFLAGCHCDLVSGNLIGNPVAINELKSLLNNLPKFLS